MPEEVHCKLENHRSRAPRVRQHVHCDSCYSRRCRARVEVSVCCAIIPCPLHCGALFHLCKEEDHLLLCPNVRVPCLNTGYGCPLHLPRSSQAAHLQVCPASVVCCSMEWLRWPTDDTNPHNTITLQENVVKENKEDLDLAMALVDQSDLYGRLKMKPIYPQLVEEEEEEIKDEKKEETAVGGLVKGFPDKDTNEDSSSCENNVVEEPTQNLGVSKEKYNRMSDMMFGMERGGCAVAQANLDNPKQNTKPGEKANTKRQQDMLENGAATDAPDTSKGGHAPWQEGVMERLGKDLTPQEFSMYMVHNGRMLVSFGQIPACTPREKDFVYGSLEPIPVQSLRSFKIPDSYHYRERVHMHETVVLNTQSEERSVDTSDLGGSEDNWFSDEAASTLLGYTEEAARGHKISQFRSYDGLYVDEGTQTHLFRSAPFKGKTTLAEVMADRPIKLHLQLLADTVDSRNHRASCAFTFLCGHTFHRREFATHFRNVHSDIQMSLNGWFEQRCPLAYLGCTYRHRRFQPSTHNATVSYSQQLRTFTLRPTLVSSVGGDFQPFRSDVDSSSAQRKRAGRTGGGEYSLCSLPYEVLCHMATFLDSLALSQLALVSQLMRQVCSSLLQERGMVTLHWEKKTYSHGGAKWKAKPVWQFSPLFSSVDSWHMADDPSISAHLKVCQYYETAPHSQPVPLPSMTEKKGESQERLSLVQQFTGN